MAQTRTTYPQEYKWGLMDLVPADGSPQESAKEFQASPNTIRKWATQTDIA